MLIKNTYASDEHKHGHEHHDEHVPGRVELSPEMAKKVGLVSDTAQAQRLNKTITLYGSLASGPEQLSHVRARFAGLIESVKITIGDQVQAGDLLAEVESNESLKTYSVLAPIAGTVIQRHANTGEVTQNQVLFSVANFDYLWAELRVYPSQQHEVKVGQSVEFYFNNSTTRSTVAHIIPSMDHPYQLVRVKVDNMQLGLFPGAMVEAKIVTETFSAELAVKNAAIQVLDNKQGVFIKNQNSYVFTPINIGMQDNQFSEVLAGMQVGDEYVSKQSYLLKADVEKSAAEHVH